MTWIMRTSKPLSMQSWMNNEDKNLLNAIRFLFETQDGRTYITSGQNLLEKYRSNGWFYTGLPFMSILANRLNNGEAPVFGFKLNNGGAHAINAIALMKDINDHNRYYVEVYDNNYSGERRIIDAQCNTISQYCYTVPNSYYDMKDKALETTISLEYDLEVVNSYVPQKENLGS